MPDRQRRYTLDCTYIHLLYTVQCLYDKSRNINHVTYCGNFSVFFFGKFYRSRTIVCCMHAPSHFHDVAFILGKYHETFNVYNIFRQHNLDVLPFLRLGSSTDLLRTENNFLAIHHPCMGKDNFQKIFVRKVFVRKYYAKECSMVNKITRPSFHSL